MTKLLSEIIKAQHGTGGLKRVKLDTTQARLWTETRTALLISCPMFSHLLYTMLTQDNEAIACFTEDEQIPIAATDNHEIMLRPSTYFQEGLLERTFILAHEIMHCVYDHPGQMFMWTTRKKVHTATGKALDYYPMLMNMAMDYQINDLLVQSKVGKMPKIGLHDPTIGNKDESVIDIYEKIYKMAGCDKKGYGGKDPGKGGFDILLSPGSGTGKDPASAQGTRNEQSWQNEVAAAVASAKLQGKLPAAMEQAFGEVLDPVVDWTDKLKSFFARKVGSGGYDWRRADRQLITRGFGATEGDSIFAPGRSGYGAGTVIMGMDSSGSIYSDPTLIDRFMAELAGILESVRPKRIIVIWCDAQVQRVDEVEDGADIESIRHKGAKGGGGTSFVPVFDWIEKENITPDALIYLTDGYGDFPKKEPSNYPVMWGNITPGYKYPFGEVIDIPTDK